MEYGFALNSLHGFKNKLLIVSQESTINLYRSDIVLLMPRLEANKGLKERTPSFRQSVCNFSWLGCNFFLD